MNDYELFKNPLYPSYRFSKDGRVWTKFQRLEWEPLKPIVSNKNYFRVDIKDKEGVRKKRLIHRLIAETFIPNPNNYPCINHKDENPCNNALENLEWCTYRYNNTYGHRLEKALGAFLKKAEEHCIPVIGIDLGGKEHFFKSHTEAARFVGCGRSTMSRHVKNGIPYNGFTFQLAERKEVYG